MTGRWLRLYDEVIDDPKVQRLPPSLFKRWINLLCVASRNDGRLPPLGDLEFALRDGEASIRKDLAALEAAGLIERDGDHYAPHNWARRQFRSDISTSRVQRHRQRKEPVTGNGEGNGARNGDETFRGTHQSRYRLRDRYRARKRGES